MHQSSKKNEQDIIRTAASKKTREAPVIQKTETPNTNIKTLPQLPQKEITQESNIEYRETDIITNELENTDAPPLPPRASSDELIKHIPTDIAESSNDEGPLTNVDQISSSSIKPILNVDSVF